MNWNNNDTKYILKRVIVYFVIACILFFAGQRCAKADTITAEFQYKNLSFNSQNRTNGTPINGGVAFGGAGSGYAIFSGVLSSDSGTTAIKSAWVNVGPNSSNLVQLQCEIGNNVAYSSNTETLQVYTFKCPGNFGTGIGIYSVAFSTMNNNSSNLYLSDKLTYVSQVSDASSINNAAAQASANEIANIIAQGEYDRINADANATRIINATNQATQQEINSINANTQAINDLSDTINAGYNSNTGTGYLNAFDNIFTQEDENVIRQFVMIPFNLYILLYNAITSGSCQSITLGALYGVNLDLPCINLRQILGVGLYTAIDTIFGACLLFGIVRMIKKFFNSLFSLSSKATDECGIEVFK